MVEEHIDSKVGAPNLDWCGDVTRVNRRSNLVMSVRFGSSRLFVDSFARYSHLLVFCPKILGGGGDLRMVLCHSLNAGSGWGYREVVGTLKFYLFALRAGGGQKLSVQVLSPRNNEPPGHQWWNFHYLIFE